jgi:hypothetical protein
MPGERTEEDARQNGAGIVRRHIDPDQSTAEYDFLEIIAELEGCEIEALPSLYNEVDNVVETMFKTPPSERAQLEISFSYAGYRVRIDRTGRVELVPVKKSLS